MIRASPELERAHARTRFLKTVFSWSQHGARPRPRLFSSKWWLSRPRPRCFWRPTLASASAVRHRRGPLVPMLKKRQTRSESCMAMQVTGRPHGWAASWVDTCKPSGTGLTLSCPPFHSQRRDGRPPMAAPSAWHTQRSRLHSHWTRQWFSSCQGCAAPSKGQATQCRPSSMQAAVPSACTPGAVELSSRARASTYLATLTTCARRSPASPGVFPRRHAASTPSRLARP